MLTSTIILCTWESSYTWDGSIVTAIIKFVKGKTTTLYCHGQLSVFMLVVIEMASTRRHAQLANMSTNSYKVTDRWTEAYS